MDEKERMRRMLEAAKAESGQEMPDWMMGNEPSQSAGADSSPEGRAFGGIG